MKYPRSPRSRWQKLACGLLLLGSACKPDTNTDSNNAIEKLSKDASAQDVQAAIRGGNFGALQSAPYALNDQFLADYFEEVPLIGMVDFSAYGSDTSRFSGALNEVNLGDTLKYRHRTVTIRGVRYFIVEGDMLLSRARYIQYKNWLLHRPISDSMASQKLISKTEKGVLLRQPPGVVMRYAVIHDSFETDAHYHQVVQCMERAANEWSMTCGVQFEHVTSMDQQVLFEPPDGLAFIVTGVDVHGAFVACAFFPNQPTRERVLLVDQSYFTTMYDPVGVFRHEIGHILGWLHEAARPEAPMVCHTEVLEGALNVTLYDPKSVMHYFCENVGSYALQLSDSDKVGSQRVYGPPLPELVGQLPAQ